ncbi:unnamed protein product, partial [Iphiclides podalirius]
MCAAIDMLASEPYYGRPAGFVEYARLPTKAPTPRQPFKPLQLTLRAPRSCLRAPDERKQKRVVFADARGLALEQVKFMTEPSHLPPAWTLRLAQPQPQLPKQPQPDPWVARFAQPAADYVAFRRRVTECHVALENVIIRQRERAADGTVKVANLAFAKEVFVRCSADGWATHEDTYCAHSGSAPARPGAPPAHDTFAFRLQLPVHSRRLDFCVGFRCAGEEYWDSNGGANYTIERASARSQAPCCARISGGNARTVNEGGAPYW